MITKTLHQTEVNQIKKIVEIVNEEELKKIDAYLEWEQEYYVINQSYLLENI